MYCISFLFFSLFFFVIILVNHPELDNSPETNAENLRDMAATLRIFMGDIHYMQESQFEEEEEQFEEDEEDENQIWGRNYDYFDDYFDHGNLYD